ncbi:unnamed protein product [Chrysoparadoxa australica]
MVKNLKRKRNAPQEEKKSDKGVDDIIATYSKSHKLPPLEETDLRYIVKHLGYVPNNALAVVARDSAGHPTAMRVHPLARPVHNKSKRAKKGGDLLPFPTTYWICCSEVRKAVSRLEVKGYIGTWEKDLQDDEEGRNSMQAAHKAYAQERWGLLSVEEAALAKERGWGDRLGSACGVAGLRDTHHIKCLHAHYAHFLSGEKRNVVGKWVQEALDRGEAELERQVHAGEEKREKRGTENEKEGAGSVHEAGAGAALADDTKPAAGSVA